VSGRLNKQRQPGLASDLGAESLRWDDIDWEMNRMSIPKPKVERHEGRGIRSCPVSRCCHRGNGPEERQPTQRDDATPAPRRCLGLATIVPFDEGQQTDGTAARVPIARGLLLAWQLTAHRPAELPAGD
jgi:hypothetical protein